MTRIPLTDEDRAWIRAELQSPAELQLPSAEERHAESMEQYKKRNKRWSVGFKRYEPLPVHKLTAQPCQCENPQTYLDEDGERRCLCGRAA